jgi:hypothetical protein
MRELVKRFMSNNIMFWPTEMELVISTQLDIGQKSVSSNTEGESKILPDINL